MLEGGYSVEDPRTRRALTEAVTVRFAERGPPYAAATFVHVGKCRATKCYLDRGPGRSIAADSPADVLAVRPWMELEQPLFLLGYGVEDPASGIHGDEEYRYVVELPEPDVVDPAETGDWQVKVSDRGGFPRWDGPTEEAFERATWQFEGSFSGAFEGSVGVTR